MEGDVPAIVNRANFAAGFVFLATGALLFALRGPWWEVHYEHKALCAENPTQCGIVGEFAVAWLCLHSPEGVDCEENSLIRTSVEDDQCSSRFAIQCAWPAYLLLTCSFAIHVPTIASLLFALAFANLSPGQKFMRRCGLRLASFLAGMAGALAAASLTMFVVSAKPCFEVLVLARAREEFGRTADTVMQAQVLYAPALGMAAVGFDAAVAALAWDQGLARFPPTPNFDHHAAAAYVSDALDFAAGTGRGDELASYSAVPSEEPQGNLQPDPSWQRPKKPIIGRYKQFHPPSVFGPAV